MIEQSVSLASNGVVKVPGYEQLVRFGYTKNRGVYRLAVTASGEWEGLAVRVFWHVPDGKDPASSLVVDGCVDVPASVTAQPGSGCITFEGSDGTKTVTSADLHCRVSANSGTEDGTMPEPDTPAWQQLVDAVHTDATAAEQAKTDAQTAAQQAGASAQAAQTAASEAVTSAGNASQSALEAVESLQELKDGIASGDFKGEKGDKGDTGSIGPVGPQGPKGDTGPAVALDTTLTHEGEAADAKATGDAISAVKVRQNILIGTETGNPIAVDDAFPAPLCGLTVYGRSTQDGTPTPDAPVPIVSAGDGGSVTVKVTGKNLLDSALMSPTFSDKGISAKQNSDGSYTISGTPTVDGTIILWIGGGWNNTVPIFTIPPGSYYSNVSIFYYDGKNRTSKKAAFTLLEPFRVTGVMYDKSYTINKSYNFLITPQIEPGSIATTYAPYREQLLTLPTPTGLPGIPVASGGNYTDSTGQQWVCDEVDFEKGVKVQRVDKAAFDSTKTLTEQNAILATPIETPLTPDEIAAYKALTAYGPDTVVQAGDGAGVKLDYQRDVNIAIKKLEDAVASMT